MVGDGRRAEEWPEQLLAARCAVPIPHGRPARGRARNTEYLDDDRRRSGAPGAASPRTAPGRPRLPAEGAQALRLSG